MLRFDNAKIFLFKVYFICTGGQDYETIDVNTYGANVRVLTHCRVQRTIVRRAPIRKLTAGERVVIPTYSEIQLAYTTKFVYQGSLTSG